jgi:NAD(P)-dependent dehydrogenase (short-subunit alcohol dehydrogenase family)
VYILGRRLQVLEDAAKEHPALIPLQCDVTAKESLQAAVDVVTAKNGYVNLVVANSGTGTTPKPILPNASIEDARRILFTDSSMDDFNRVLSVNVTGAFFTAGAFLELLDKGNANALKGGFGAPLEPGSTTPSIQSQIIVTSSITAYSRSIIVMPAYAASKAAVMHLTKTLSTSLARFGIRANGLAPGCK